MSSNSVDNATREWVQLRKKLYLNIKSDVLRLLAHSLNEFIPLEKNYARELTQPWRAVTKEVMYERLSQSDLVLLGDFHALQQSQRGHLRVLRDFPDPSVMVLAVEFFQARHQKYINQYLRGTLSEKQFLKKISWEKTWGFPWEHYKPIVDWAKENRVPIYGINWGLRSTQIRSIKMRENFSAMCLRKIHKQQGPKKIFVIYGDLHLTGCQLPSALRKIPIFRKALLSKVFQNYEPIYFQALNRGLEQKIELLQFKSGDFCIQSVPPWVKWQSYLFFLENTFDRQYDESEEDLDHTDQVAKLVEFLAAEFKVQVDSSELAVYTASDTRVYSRIRQALAKREWATVKKWMGEERSFYVPELKFGYLGRITVNHIAALAGEYIHAALARRQRVYFSGPKDFERQIWIQTMAYLGSKVINHKRKTNSLEDLRKSLLLGDTKEGRRDVLLLALHQKVREITYLKHGGRGVGLRNRKRVTATYIEAARLLGAMLGEKVYHLYQSQKISRAQVVELFKKPVGDSEFNKSYYRLIKFIYSKE